MRIIFKIYLEDVYLWISNEGKQNRIAEIDGLRLLAEY